MSLEKYNGCKIILEKYKKHQLTLWPDGVGQGP